MEKEELRQKIDELEDSVEKGEVRILEDDMYFTIQDIYKINTEHNLIIAMEELAELTQQISKRLRGKGDNLCLQEEIADVMFNLIGIMGLEGVDPDIIDEIMYIKTQRALDRIAKGGNKY